MYSLEFRTKRQWGDAEGYRYLAPWSNLVLLRILVRVITDNLTKGEYRLKRQIDDAARSAVSTLEEIKGDIYRMLEDGFLKSKQGSSLKDLGIDLKEFKEFIGRRSQKIARAKIIEEIKGRVKGKARGTFKGNSSKHSFKESSNNPLNLPLREIIGKDYPPLQNLNPSNLTFEMLIELINKTDYLLRRLVLSLQKKDPIFSQEIKDDLWVKRIAEKYKGKVKG